MEGMYSGISGLFDTVKVKGEVLSRAHQPVLVAIPSYDDVKGMPFVSMRGIKVHAPPPPEPLIAQADPAPEAPQAPEPPPPPAPPEPPETKTGEVYLDTGEDVCEVYVDGVKTGHSSNNAFELKEGKHLLALYLSKTNFNHTVLVDVEPGQKNRLEIALRGRLRVESRPSRSGETAPDLDVYLDSRSVGRTDMDLKDIPAGTHSLRVVINGVTKTRQIEIRPDSPLIVRYKIVRKAAPARVDDMGKGDVTF